MTSFEAPAAVSAPKNMEELIAAQQQVVQDMLPADVKHGVLVPLKTTLELRDDHNCVQVALTRVPVKTASSVIK